MARKPKSKEAEDRPLHGIVVNKYDDFHADMKAFGESKYKFLMVVGPGGTGKTQGARRFVPNAVMISGDPTPFDLYKTVYNAGDRPIVFNDVAQKVWSDNTFIALMKQLTETTPTKELQWNSNAAPQAGYPKKFTTSSPVLILANRWKSLDANIRALESRAELTVMFHPTAYEVHRQVSLDGWFDDQIVYDFMYDNLRIIPEASFRWYVTGQALRKARPDKWSSRLLEMMLGNQQMKAVADLLLDPKYKSNQQRATAFAEQFSSCERQFYRLKKEFANLDSVDTTGENFTLSSKSSPRKKITTPTKQSGTTRRAAKRSAKPKKKAGGTK